PDCVGRQPCHPSFFPSSIVLPEWPVILPQPQRKFQEPRTKFQNCRGDGSWNLVLGVSAAVPFALIRCTAYFRIELSADSCPWKNSAVRKFQEPSFKITEMGSWNLVLGISPRMIMTPIPNFPGPRDRPTDQAESQDSTHFPETGNDQLGASEKNVLPPGGR